MKRYAFTLDLKDDLELIEAYKEHHRKVWPEVKASIKEAGIQHIEIYLLGNRLFMVMEVKDNFSFEKKAEMDAANPIVQEWEKLMWKYQQALPQAGPGEKWIMMERIFQLD
ncbi:MAG: L-rhamnose mutarotase [Candidatus Cyclobacteriaceae bacterium M3_2C_046]